MSLLEDVFLEDEAGEAQELERVIEGDEFDERPRSTSPNSDENSEKEDEAEEDKRRVDPNEGKPKQVIKNPRFILNPARLTGPRGIQVLPEHFKDFKFKGKGHEREDLDLVLKKLEHWAYRLYPKFEFVDCLKKIETLGKKRPVMVHLHKIRTDQITSDEIVTQKDSSDEETQQEPAVDEFDVLLQQQIDLARATPGPHEHQHSAKKGMETPLVEKFIMPKATSSPSINDEQRERMLRNRRLAEERRLARLKEKSSESNTSIANDSANNKNDNSANDSVKHNNSNVIDSSDDEIDNNYVDKPITVDVHSAYSEITQKKYEHTNSKDTDNIICKKHNRTNVIDSSDEETDNKYAGLSVTVDLHSANTEISQKNDENTDDNIISKKHKANIIDSSDEETDNNIVDQSIIVDVHSANSELSQTNDENTNDTDNIISKKHRKSNVIDSSDEEIDNNIVGQSMAVDVHDTNSEISQINDKNHIDSDINRTNNVDSEMIIDSTSHNDIVSNDISSPQQNINTEISQLTENKTDDSEIKNSNLTGTNKSLNCSNLQESENVPEEIMDVDFSDDF